MDISHLESLPLNVLLYDILPTLTLTQLNSLCQASNKLRQLCNHETLWITKIKKEFPTRINDNPEFMTEKQYYIFLFESRTVTMYLNGDKIGNTLVKLPSYDYAIWDIRNRIIKSDDYSLIFLNFFTIPLAIYSYKSDTLAVIDKDLFPSKVLIVNSDLTPIITLILSGKYVNTSSDPLFGPLGLLLYNNLFSHLSAVPIYATFSVGKESGNVFDRRNSAYIDDPRRRRFMGDCQYLPPAKIADLARFFQIPTSSNGAFDICESIMEYLTSIGHVHDLP